MKKFLLSAFALSAPLAMAGMPELPGSPDSQGLTLDELKVLCHQSENNRQIKPFSSNYTCSESRETTFKVGEETKTFEKDSVIKFKAAIKNNSEQSGWVELNEESTSAKAKCPTLEQWTVTAFHSEEINSCADLDRIVDEQQYCKEKLAPVWTSCMEERDQAQAPFQAPTGSRCEWEQTGVVLSCGGEPQTPGNEQEQPQPEGTTTSASSNTSLSSVSSASYTSISSTENGGTSLSSSEVAAAAEAQTQPTQVTTKPTQQQADPNSMGADVRLVKVKRKHVWGLVSLNHKVMQVTSFPQPGSLLSQLGVTRGEAVSRINGKRIRSHADLLGALREARRTNKSVKVELRTRGGEFVDAQRTLR